MTDENRFFRYLWRFNALVLAGLGIAGACAAIGSFLFPWRPAELAPKGGFAPIPAAAEKEFTYRLEDGGVSQWVGQEGIAALERWKGAPASYGLEMKVMIAASSSRRWAGNRNVNMLAVNSGDASSHWLFKGYDRAILSDDLIYPGRTTAEQSADRYAPLEFRSAATALVMTVVDADTNGDGDLSEKDRQSFYVYRPGTGDPVKLFTADLIKSAHQTGPSSYLVIYEKGRSAFAATYSIPDFKLVAEKPLPDVPK
jgi:hypothetical protein